MGLTITPKLKGRTGQGHGRQCKILSQQDISHNTCKKMHSSRLSLSDSDYDGMCCSCNDVLLTLTYQPNPKLQPTRARFQVIYILLKAAQAARLYITLLASDTT